MTPELWNALGLMILVVAGVECVSRWLDARSTRIRITKDWPDA